MHDVLSDLRARARFLHTSVRVGAPAARARVKRLPELRTLAEADLGEHVKRRHCLAVVARELGFAGWSHLTAALSGDPIDDFGELLCPPGRAAYWNIWSASYEEARALRGETGGYLLAFKRHFFICDRHYIESLGLDPEDPDWERMGRDWARPADPGARRRFYDALIRSRCEG